MIKFSYIVGCILFTVFGQILVKIGAVMVKDETSIWSYILNYYIAGGLLMAVLAAGSWIMALQHFKLSYAYPFMSLSFPIVAILSVFFLNESIKMNQWIGLTIVIIGLYVAGR